MEVYKYEFSRAYLKQMNMPLTDQNLAECGLDTDYMYLLFENKDYYVIRYATDEIETINVVFKKSSNLESIEIGYPFAI